MPDHYFHKPYLLQAALILFCLVLPGGSAMAALDLSAASVERLDNGLTLIMLENHSLPVVSVQMLYRAGARDESSGQTGLAHFLEHMAFRESEHFPDTQLVSSIYAVGGEWHGYTWLDQTTYFATVPVANLNLLLRIEADRMSRLTIPKSDVASERGAVLTELHSYENDPNSVLQDHVLYQSFLGHPYRNNTIGWESDVENINHADLVAFYQRHYHPGNAVLAVVGDIQSNQVRKAVLELFGGFEGRAATPRPHTVEPRQSGTRRIELQGPVTRKHFKIAYHAPGVRSPDYATFLVVQDLLAAGSGISFLQNDWGTAARNGSPLASVSEDVTTWFPPSDQDYIFTINGSVTNDRDESSVEIAVEKAIANLRSQMSGDNGGPLVKQARDRVLRELIFDIQTTEDAAHQLAYFAGMDALDVLIGLPDRLESVHTGNVNSVLDRYLRPAQATIGWYLPAVESTPQTSGPTALTRETSSSGRTPSAAAISTETLPAPSVERLSNGTPVIAQRSGLSSTVMLKVIVPAGNFDAIQGGYQSEPVRGLISFDFELLPGELNGVLMQARKVIERGRPMFKDVQPAPTEPTALLNHTLRELMSLDDGFPNPNLAPLLLVVSGDIDPTRLLDRLESEFGELPANNWIRPDTLPAIDEKRVEVRFDRPLAQEQLGYIALVPGPREQTIAVAQIALYVLQHGYEGRLGKKAISDSGLVYYIDTEYATDGTNDWISLSMGVDPDKMQAMQALLLDEIARLRSKPPTDEEIAEARNHLLGRYISGAQSNPELADRLTRQWLLLGKLEDTDDYSKRLEAVSRQDILDILPAITTGSMAAVINPTEPSD